MPRKKSKLTIAQEALNDEKFVKNRLQMRVTTIEKELELARGRTDAMKKDQEKIINALRLSYERIGYLTMNPNGASNETPAQQ